jgi:hydrogenase assembly chaperone HypC/HupF
MCLAIVGSVLSIDDVLGTAVVQADDRRWDVSLAPIVLTGGRVRPGDWLLLHTGLAIAVLGEVEARQLINTTRSLFTGDMTP